MSDFSVLTPSFATTPDEARSEQLAKIQSDLTAEARKTKAFGPRVEYFNSATEIAPVKGFAANDTYTGIEVPETGFIAVYIEVDIYSVGSFNGGGQVWLQESTGKFLIRTLEGPTDSNWTTCRATAGMDGGDAMGFAAGWITFPADPGITYLRMAYWSNGSAGVDPPCGFANRRMKITVI